ncbi:phage minor head protein [Avibacterium sp. 21-594]|uniref:phage minor head protein n=1 Tax=Avibacterium sp. 21-594 TaxID=2911535 RepID=UPI00224546FA|nr:phage minor head protein [Avibacterium sp. 21-594]MCW9716768.1 phage head morphogenesis protein [Avibacterium sp. 21-594]
MALTVDEQIEIGLADNKILLFRFDAHLRKEVYERLNAMQKRLLSRISAVGIESVSQKALKQLLKEISELVDETYQDIHQVTAKDLKALLPLQAEALTKIYNQAVKFDLFNQVPDYRIKAIRNAEIIAGAPLEDWWRKQGDNLTFDFERTIRSGMIEGASYNDLVKSVKEITGRSRRGAETLVRTAVMKVNDAAHEALRDENEDLLNGEQHVSTLDTRTSEICRLRDGLSWDMEQQPIGGHKIPYKRPPLHPNCRSDLKLLIKSWKELGINLEEIPESTKASLDGQVKSSMNYEDWLKTKSEAEQDKILGKGKAKLWRDGVITFRDMLDQSGRPLTLKELSEIYGSNKWKDFIEMQPLENAIKHHQNVQGWIDLGKGLSAKHQHLIDEALNSSKPHESILQILTKEGVQLGGSVNVIGSKSDKIGIAEFTKAVQVYPSAWIKKSNEKGTVFIRNLASRAFHRYVNTDNIHQDFANFKKKGLVKQGDSLIIRNTKHPELWRLKTHIHEYGHRLQNIFPEMDRVFEEFWRARTANDQIEDLHDLLPHIYTKRGEIVKKDHFINPYFGKIYYEPGLSPYNGYYSVEKPLEMLTMTFESILGGVPERFKLLYEKDPDLFYLGLALLARFK